MYIEKKRRKQKRFQVSSQIEEQSDENKSSQSNDEVVQQSQEMKQKKKNSKKRKKKQQEFSLPSQPYNSYQQVEESEASIQNTQNVEAEETKKSEEQLESKDNISKTENILQSLNPDQEKLKEKIIEGATFQHATILVQKQVQKRIRMFETSKKFHHFNTPFDFKQEEKQFILDTNTYESGPLKEQINFLEKSNDVLQNEDLQQVTQKIEINQPDESIHTQPRRIRKSLRHPDADLKKEELANKQPEKISIIQTPQPNSEVIQLTLKGEEISTKRGDMKIDKQEDQQVSMKDKQKFNQQFQIETNQTIKRENDDKKRESQKDKDLISEPIRKQQEQQTLETSLKIQYRKDKNKSFFSEKEIPVINSKGQKRFGMNFNRVYSQLPEPKEEKPLEIKQSVEYLPKQIETPVKQELKIEKKEEEQQQQSTQPKTNETKPIISALKVSDQKQKVQKVQFKLENEEEPSYERRGPYRMKKSLESQLAKSDIPAPENVFIVIAEQLLNVNQPEQSQSKEDVNQQLQSTEKGVQKQNLQNTESKVEELNQQKQIKDLEENKQEIKLNRKHEITNQVKNKEQQNTSNEYKMNEQSPYVVKHKNTNSRSDQYEDQNSMKNERKNQSRNKSVESKVVSHRYNYSISPSRENTWNSPYQVKQTAKQEDKAPIQERNDKNQVEITEKIMIDNNKKFYIEDQIKIQKNEALNIEKVREIYEIIPDIISEQYIDYIIKFRAGRVNQILNPLERRSKFGQRLNEEYMKCIMNHKNQLSQLVDTAKNYIINILEINADEIQIIEQVNKELIETIIQEIAFTKLKQLFNIINQYQRTQLISQTVIIKSLGIELIKYENWILNNYFTDPLLQMILKQCKVSFQIINCIISKRILMFCLKWNYYRLESVILYG